jgi:hypothetical protein
MASSWPALSYALWRPSCDTLHAHTQVLGKLAVALAPPEPQLQHAALRLTARGWETAPLAAPDGSGAFVAALDLHAHSLAGAFEIDPTPQEVTWTAPLDEDTEHASYDPALVETYFAAATRAALVLADFRAPFRGRSTPVNAWWGSFDLAVSLFSGAPAEPPASDFIMRNAMDSQEVAVGWWPGDERHETAAFYAYAHPAAEGFPAAEVSPAPAHWDESLGEYLLEWEDVRAGADPHGAALEFARSVFRHACVVCEWDPALAASADGHPPPVR